MLLPLAVFGSFISYIYSAPPLKLKQSGWAGNYALGASYIALPWLAGQVPPIRRHCAAVLIPLGRRGPPLTWSLTGCTGQLCH